MSPLIINSLSPNISIHSIWLWLSSWFNCGALTFSGRSSAEAFLHSLGSDFSFCFLFDLVSQLWKLELNVFNIVKRGLDLQNIYIYFCSCCCCLKVALWILPQGWGLLRPLYSEELRQMPGQEGNGYNKGWMFTGRKTMENSSAFNY